MKLGVKVRTKLLSTATTEEQFFPALTAFDTFNVYFYDNSGEETYKAEAFF